MGIENPVHLLFIAIVALIVLGPKRLPELARALGHGIREFRDAVSQEAATPAEPAIAQQPVAQEPVAQAPVTQQPAAQQPVTQAPATPQPVAPQAPAQGQPDRSDTGDPAQTIRSGDAPDRGPL